jgi:hypothetical protein
MYADDPEKWAERDKAVAKGPRLMKSSDPAHAERVFEAMQKMVKLDVAELERAAAG